MSSQHWTLDTAKEKLDPAELQMLETHYKIEGQKEAVEYILEAISNMIDIENSAMPRHIYLYALENVQEEINRKYSHLFDKEVANA